MEIFKKKCSLKEHSDINANIYCKKCDIYICNKCEVYHSKLFESHKNYILSSNINEINDEFCGEENHHNYELKYYCKDHNILCCAACIAKIKTKGDGQHMNCEVCCIEDIKEEKLSKIKKNIILLEELSSNFSESFKEIKKIYDQIICLIFRRYSTMSHYAYIQKLQSLVMTFFHSILFFKNFYLL